MIHHNERWTVMRRGPRPYERFTPMTPAETLERRVALGHRQGGLGQYRRHLIDEVCQCDNVAMPPPPPPPLYRGRCGSTTHRRRVRSPSPLRQPASSRHAAYRPAGYRSDTPESVSSLSEGGYTSADRQLSDELAELDAGRHPYHLDELHMPHAAPVFRIRAVDSDESDWETCMPPNEVMPPSSSPRMSTGEVENPSAARCDRREFVAFERTDADRYAADRDRQPLQRDAACDPRPSTPPPVFYSRMTQAVPDTSEASTWTSALPRPWFRDPGISTQHLAKTALRIQQEYRTTPVDRLSDRLTSALDVHDVSRRRTIQLMADFAYELLRLSADYLLQETAARFGHWDHVPLQQIVQFATDELGVWARRPSLPRQPIVSIDSDSDTE